VSDIVSRLLRSIPALGLAAHWFQRAERLRIADEEDEAYKATMEAMDAQPHFAGATRARETRMIIGQLAGCLVATALGTVLAVLTPAAWPTLALLTWGIAVVLDMATACLAVWLYDRKAAAHYDRVVN
jgi:hypothetical protein